MSNGSTRCLNQDTGAPPDKVGYSRKFFEAFSFANDKHQGQFRKGTDIPYIVHPMAVAAITAEHGGDEEQVIAALLHDVVEDTEATAEQIAQLFGRRVSAIVANLSDSIGDPKPPWEQRKQKYIEHLGQVDADSLLVCAADKYHNVRAIVRDVLQHGEQVWQRFNAAPVRIGWYYTSLAEVFSERLSGRLRFEFEREVGKLIALIQETER